MKQAMKSAWVLAALLAAVSASGQVGPAEESPTQYVLRTNDRLQYRIAEDPVRGSTPMTVTVNSVGEASFPVSRDSDIRLTLNVRGRTMSEVARELQRRLTQDYYHKATVELALAEKVVNPGKVQFFGEVSATIPLLPDSPPLYLSDALLQRPSEFANLRRVKVHRVDPVTQESRVIEVNVREILKNGRRDLDIVLQDGDRVEVLQKWFN